ncbi:hypothetical protein FN846DRAFT_759769, partial [Sphaerosporella brunnea]
LATRSELGNDEEIKEDAEGALEQALNEEELHVEEVSGELVAGNRRGLNLAGLSKRVKELETKDALQDLKGGSLEDRVGSLTSSLSAYKLQRNRFISTYKRGKLGSATAKDGKIIGAGNASVHGGDAIDAMLYSSTDKDGRRDVDAYEQLYEMDP